MRPGDWVRVQLADGTTVSGQVWSPAEQEDSVWVAMENGTYVRAQTRSGLVRDERGAKIGRVAA